MREISIEEANQSFSQVIAAVLAGETIVITNNGIPVAKVLPAARNPADDPKWQSALKALQQSLLSKRAIGFRVGGISENDKYGGGAA